MNYFNGNFKSKPSINLSGSSRNVKKNVQRIMFLVIYKLYILFTILENERGLDKGGCDREEKARGIIHSFSYYSALAFQFINNILNRMTRSN
jgi:hypothetical protein